jgi:hypothetical protein
MLLVNLLRKAHRLSRRCRFRSGGHFFDPVDEPRLEEHISGPHRVNCSPLLGSHKTRQAQGGRYASLRCSRECEHGSFTSTNHSRASVGVPRENKIGRADYPGQRFRKRWCIQEGFQAAERNGSMHFYQPSVSSVTLDMSLTALRRLAPFSWRTRHEPDLTPEVSTRLPNSRETPTPVGVLLLQAKVWIEMRKCMQSTNIPGSLWAHVHFILMVTTSMYHRCTQCET